MRARTTPLLTGWCDRTQLAAQSANKSKQILAGHRRPTGTEDDRHLDATPVSMTGAGLHFMEGQSPPPVAMWAADSIRGRQGFCVGVLAARVDSKKPKVLVAMRNQVLSKAMRCVVCRDDAHLRDVRAEPGSEDRDLLHCQGASEA